MKRFQKGFTLIELLAVIAIIGILAALILVSLSNARKQGRDTQRKSIVRAIAQAEESYFNERNTYAPLGTLTTIPSGSTEPYLQNPTGAKCRRNNADQTSWVSCIEYTATTYTIWSQLEGNTTKGFKCTTGGNCKDCTVSGSVCN